MYVIYMLSKNTYVGCKKTKANQKQQLSDYEYIAILTTKCFDISKLASYNLLFRGCHASKYFLI